MTDIESSILNKDNNNLINQDQKLTTTSTSSITTTSNHNNGTNIKSSLFLEDGTGSIFYNNRVVHIRLDSNYFLIFKPLQNNKPLLKLPSNSLIGLKYSSCNYSNSILKKKIIANKVTICFCLPDNRSLVNKSSGIRKRQVITLYFTHGVLECKRWFAGVESIVRGVNITSKNITDYLVSNSNTNNENINDSSSGSCSESGSFSNQATNQSDLLKIMDLFRPRNILVFLNPVSGKGTALKVWRQHIKPIFDEAYVKVEFIRTTHANHAQEFVQSHSNLIKYYCIVVISGDGLLYEVINGITSRPDGKEILDKVMFSPIPGGTGNGLAKSILFQSNEVYHPINSTFVTIRGRKSPLDLSTVSLNNNKDKLLYSFLSLSWGLIADIDILSESMRFLGESRLFVSALYFILKKQRYRGKVSMKLIDKTTYYDSNSNNVPVKYKNNTVDLSKVHVNKLNPNEKLIEKEDGKWLEIEGEFLYVWVLQSSHASANVYSGPGIRLNDGVFTIHILPLIKRAQITDLLLNMDPGNHIYNSKLRIFQCTEYKIEPVIHSSSSEGKNGIFSLDGEVIQYCNLHGKILPSGANVLSF